MATATELPINTSATALDMADEIFGSGMVTNNATYSGGAFTVTHINAQAILASDPANNSITMATGQIITLLPSGTFQIQVDADLETVYFN